MSIAPETIPGRPAMITSYDIVDGLKSADNHESGTFSRRASAKTFRAAKGVVFIPFTLRQQFNITHLFIAWGSAGTTQYDLGIYNLDGVKLVSTGALTSANAGAGTWIAVSPNFTLGIGAYYFGLTLDSTTDTIAGSSLEVASTNHFSIFLGLLSGDTASFGLPATFAGLSGGAAVTWQVSDIFPLVGIVRQKNI